MKKTIYHLRFTIYTLVIIFTMITNASAGAFDNVGLNARPLGMGEAFTAVGGGLDSVNYNSAGLAELEMAQLLLSYRDFYGLKLLTQKYAGFSVPQDFFNIGFSWHRIGTTSSVDFIDYDEDTFIVTLAGWLGAYRDLSVGANLKFFRVHSDSNASGYGFDAGIQYATLYRRLKFGLFCKDIDDTKISWDTGAEDLLKKQYVFGVNYNILKWISLAMDYSSLKKMNIGSEISLFDEKITLRGGIKGVDTEEMTLNSGVSFKLNNYKFDYALASHKDLGLTHFFTLNVGFKKVKL